MMAARKDNLYIIRMRGNISSKMVEEQRLPFVLYAVCTAALLAQGSQGTMFYEYVFKC